MGMKGGPGSSDAGQTTPHMLWDSLPSSEFPSTYFGDLLQNVMPPDDWFPLGNGDLGNVADLSHVAAELGSVADLAGLTPDLAGLTPDMASATADLASLIP